MRGPATVALTVLALAGCASSEEVPAFTVASPTTTSAFLGTTLDKPMPQPDVTLTDTAGEPFNVAQDTKGKVVALYIGYTNCPDVCPTTMADLSVAMGSLPDSVTEQIDVVMITLIPSGTPQPGWASGSDRSPTTRSGSAVPTPRFSRRPRASGSSWSRRRRTLMAASPSNTAPR